MRCRIIFTVQLLRQQLGNCRGDVALAQRYDADGIDDLHRIALLVEVTTGTLPDQIDRIVLFRVAAENQYADIRRLGPDHGQGVDATLSRHGKVHDQDVKLHVAHQINRLTSAGGFTHHAQINLIGKELLEAGTHDGMVVNNSDFDHFISSL